MVKKGLFISIGSLAIGAALSFMLTSCDSGGGSKPEEVKFSVDKTTITLDESKKGVINLDWTPSNHSIEFRDFTFELENQTEVIPAIDLGETSSRPLELTITFNDLTDNDKGDLKFHYNDKTAKKEGEGKVTGINVKLPEPPVESWTASLDDDSKDFGNLSADYKTGDSVTIEEYIGETYATITFIPETEYKDTEFIVTAEDTKGSTFEVSYAPGISGYIAITSDKEFVDGDIVTLHFTEPHVESWTASLDDDSKDFGDLSFDLETGDSITIEDYIGFDYALINFVPKEEYKNTKFTITAKNTKRRTFEVSYIMASPVFYIQIKSDKKFVDGDVVTLHFNDPAAVSWTLKLDADSAKYGDLQYKSQTADSVTINEYIGVTTPITMTFIPTDDYKETQFTITAIDREEGTVVVGDYVPPSGISEEASFSIQREEGFADDDVIILHFGVAHIYTFL